MAKIIVTEEKTHFVLKFNYSKELVEAVKLIPGRKFDSENRTWKLPLTARRSLQRLIAEFENPQIAMKQVPIVEQDSSTVYPTCTKDHPLWAHQLAALRYMWNKPATLLHLDMGSGKSRIIVDYVLNKEGIRKVLIVAPLSVVGVWPHQFATHGGKSVLCGQLDNTAGNVGQKTKKAAVVCAEAARRNMIAVVVINYESLWREPFADWALDAKFDLLVLDECFVAGTLVSTPTGEVPIEMLQEGDIVYGYDHESGQVVETPVIHTFRSETTAKLYPFYGTRGTGNHPVWTEESGYITLACFNPLWCTVLKLQGETDAKDELCLRAVPTRFSVVQNSVTVRQQGSADEFSWSAGRHTVFNIETGTGNYFAQGLLVHNCQAIKSAGSKISKFTHRLSKVIPTRVGCSGTPCSHSPLDIYGIYRTLDQSIFGTRFQAFQNSYAVMGGFGNKQVQGYINQEAMREKIDLIRFRVAPEGYTLPPEVHSDILLTLPDAARTIYTKLEKEFYAGVQDGSVTVANAAVLLTRLQALASGFLPVEDRLGTTTLRELHTEKHDALVSYFDSVEPSEAVVVFCRFRRDLETIHQAAKAAGRKSSELSGTVKTLTDWQAGKTTVLAAQTRAGATGVDMTRTHRVVYMTYTFSLADFLQSKARIRRPGQEKDVCYYTHLLTKDTVDVKIRRALDKKSDIITSLMGI